MTAAAQSSGIAAPSPQAYCFAPIGVVRSCYTDKFGIPRQPRLVMAGEARLVLHPPYARSEALRALEGFSHLWLVFVFHDCVGRGWSPTVRPPRLKGRKVGVFASRSPFRPSPIGISAVELVGIEGDPGGLALRLRGADLLDGTPVLDIKPYLPYTDAIPQARGGYADAVPSAPWRIALSEAARAGIAAADPGGVRELERLIVEVLGQDPRPGYMDRYPQRREFGMRLYDVEVLWRMHEGWVEVVSVTPAAE